jgi:hypothetical protein
MVTTPNNGTSGVRMKRGKVYLRVSRQHSKSQKMEAIAYRNSPPSGNNESGSSPWRLDKIFILHTLTPSEDNEGGPTF